MYCVIIFVSFLNCDWLLIGEVQWLYWTQKLLVPVEKFTVRIPKVRFGLATPWLETQWSSHWAIQHKSYFREGVEFIQLVYCIIIYLSFLNCDWLLIREWGWGTWGTWGSNSQPLDYKPHAIAIDQSLDYKPRAVAIELYSSKAIPGKELSLSSWVIASLYICHFSTVIDFWSEKYSGSTGQRNSWYQ